MPFEVAGVSRAEAEVLFIGSASGREIRGYLPLDMPARDPVARL